VFQVFHKRERALRCHHCGFAQPVPDVCPDCGNVDIEPVGKGTEQLQEHLIEALASSVTQSGAPLRVGRLDADTAPNAQALEEQLAAMHAGEVDVLVGTQMIAKGHDFRRITLVAAINPDSALYTSDFRAPERLFALLMQASGRAGRDQSLSQHGEMWVQTWVPEHPLYLSLGEHDFPAFANQQLREREAAQLPPFVHHALVRAEAKSQKDAQGFLNQAAQAIRGEMSALSIASYPAVPMATARVANLERAQWLLESTSRPALQQILLHVQDALHRRSKTHRVVRWAIDVDPLSI
jgi:primosomal protein N' (replication factor Y)